MASETRLFDVIEYSSFFAVRHNPTGKEAHIGDGVDMLWDGAGHPIQPGSPRFIDELADAMNNDPDETLEAYFPELADDDGSDDELTEVDIPDEFIQLATDWHSGIGDMLYAVSSTGGVGLGSQRPHDDDAGRPMTDREWHAHLWDCLACDVRAAIRSAEKSNHGDTDELRRFEEFAESTASELRKEYGIEA